MNKNFKISFEEWCLNFGFEWVLNLWDYDKNNTLPSEIGSKSDLAFWFKCPKNNTYCNGELRKISSLVKSLNEYGKLQCTTMYSFEQWCKDSDRNEWLGLWDYELNKITPSDIQKGSSGKYWFKCPNGLHNSELKILSSYTRMNKNINCKACKKESHNKDDGYNYEINHKCTGISIGDRDGRISELKKSNTPLTIENVFPEIVKYLVNNCDRMCTYGSSKKIMVRCPECGHIKKVAAYNLTKHAYKCGNCGDGVSYPNKFIYSLLNQLAITFISENIFDWAKSKRYDVYIKHLNIVIENHGIQHYVASNRKGARTLEDEQENDKLKSELAINNNIEHYIVLDCSKSEMEWIKQSVMNSELPKLLNFKEEDIDWDECDRCATKNLAKEVCDIWETEEFINIQKMSKAMNVSVYSIKKYLKKGNSLGWCNYEQKKLLPVICDGVVYRSIRNFSKEYNLNNKTVGGWLDGTCNMPEKFKNLGLMFC